MATHGRTTLSIADNYRLMKFIEAEFTKSGMSMSEFAVRASTELGITTNKDHIYIRCQEMGIPNNRSASKSDELVELKSLVEMLARELAEAQADIRSIKKSLHSQGV